MLVGMGWLTCVPFDYDPMTGEPIVQCNSISDQMPCDAGVPQYPGEGYCPSTVNGYVPELFARLPGVAGLGRPYWELPGGFMPLEEVARANNAPAPSEAMLRASDAERMRQITGGAIQNYTGAAFRSMLPEFQPRPAPSQPAPLHEPMAVRVVRTPSGLPGPQVSQATRSYRAGRSLHGLAECYISQQSQGVCPDGSMYGGTWDSGGAAPSACGPGFLPSGGGCVPNYAAEAAAALNTPTSTPSTSSPGGCPTGYILLAGAGVCVPVSSPAGAAQQAGHPLPLPGAPTTDWKKYAMIGGAVLLGVMVMAMVAKR